MQWYVPGTCMTRFRVTGQTTSAMRASRLSRITRFSLLQYTWNNTFLSCFVFLHICILLVGNGGMSNNALQGSQELLKYHWSFCWFTTCKRGALRLRWSEPVCWLDGWLLGLGCFVVFLCLLSELFFEVFVLTVLPLFSRCFLEACCVLLPLVAVTAAVWLACQCEDGLESSAFLSACLWAFLPLLATALMLEAVPGGRVAVKLI